MWAALKDGSGEYRVGRWLIWDRAHLGRAHEQVAAVAAAPAKVVRAIVANFREIRFLRRKVGREETMVEALCRSSKRKYAQTR
jgi:hypothetical protein